MRTIPIEAEISTEQLLRAVEQLPPGECAALLARLLERARLAAPGGSAQGAADDTRDISDRQSEHNPDLAAAGIFADDSFAAEVDAYIAAQREREREEAAQEADA
ncbi:MAG: hypothetical protein ACRDIE_23035 [Chloroflexota bacterium]